MGSFARLLGQAMPTDTTAVTIYTKPVDAVVFLDQIIVCNTSGGTPTYRIFHDDDGATYATSNALFYDVPMVANTSVIIDIKGSLYTALGTIGVRSSSGNDITFTLYGEEVFQS